LEERREADVHRGNNRYQLRVGPVLRTATFSHSLRIVYASPEGRVSAETGQWARPTVGGPEPQRSDAAAMTMSPPVQWTAAKNDVGRSPHEH
jgi:hypothetical protein